MKKQHVVIGITCILLFVAGICYSYSYKREQSSTELITNLSGDTRNEAEEDINHSASEGNVSGVVTDPSTDVGAAINSESNPEPSLDKANQAKAKIIYVHLCGEVVKPGVYEVAEASRVIELIVLAGGLTKEAAGDYVNQAQQVHDGQRIYIPSKEELKELPAMTDVIAQEEHQEKQSSSELRININLAGAKELMELPGVGEAKAASIIEYRTANGSFQKIEDLMKIPGIKEGLFSKVSSYITVR